MSLMQQPHTPSPHTQSWLKAEWDHWVDLPLFSFCLFFLLSIILFPINPLLPLASYAIQLWAGSSWTWRDRWASVWVWAKQGAAFVGLVAAIMWLASAHVWFIAELVAALQTFWRMHLPGEFSLSPLEADALLARSLLLLPLAPALALLYEWMAPRTRMHLQRVLTAADFVPPPRPTPVPPPAPANAAAPAPQTSTHVRRPASRLPKKEKPAKPTSTRQHADNAPRAKQMTIESMLPTEHIQTPSAKPAQTTAPRTTPNPQGTNENETAHINWDDVAE